MMGAGWNTPSDHPLIRGFTWPSGRTYLEYGERTWVSYSERAFYFEADA